MAACIPVTLWARDIDTDPTVEATLPKRYWPIFKISLYPNNGYVVWERSSVRRVSAGGGARPPARRRRPRVVRE